MKILLRPFKKIMVLTTKNPYPDNNHKHTTVTAYIYDRIRSHF